MGNWKCVPRKPRKHPSILRTANAFEEAFHNREFDVAARIVLGCALEVLGTKGIMGALDNANSVIRRMNYRRGL